MGKTSSFGIDSSFVARLSLNYVSMEEPPDLRWSHDEEWTQVYVAQAEPTFNSLPDKTYQHDPIIQTRDIQEGTPIITRNILDPETHIARVYEK